MSLPAGTRIGAYEITALVGAGGMGEVYGALDTRLERRVAIKHLTSAIGAAARERLQREARTIASLNHPHICTIHELADHGEQLFIVMEYIDGQPLSRLVTEALPASTVVRYGTQLADGLAHAHERGIVHRDLKGANVMVTTDGRVKILDFGIAGPVAEAVTTAATRTGTAAGIVTGTTGYIAPEVLKGSPADQRSDIWALGIVLFEMASGRHPFRGQTTFELTSAILRDEPAPLPKEIGAPLTAIVTRCLAKEPALRYQRAGEVRAALEAIALVAAHGSGTADDAVRIQSLAVLPLENLSRDPSQDFFADGMTDALITDLAQIPDLRIIARTSVMRFKGVSRPLPEIARELNVQGIVSGSVLHAGDQVRISVQLSEALTERVVWAQRYERAMSAILSLQDDVARAVAREIRASTRGAAPAARPAVNSEVYIDYLKARHHWNRYSEPEIRKAMAILERALTRDPNYGPLYAGLAVCHTGLGWLGAELPDKTFPRAKEMARRAIGIDESLAEAYCVLGYAATFYDWDAAEANKTLRRALDLHPGSADAHLHYAWLLTAIGNHDGARSAALRALELDPLSPLVIGNQAYLAVFDRQYETAEHFARQALEVDPSHVMNRWTLGISLIFQERYDQAICELEETVRAWPGALMLGWCGYACARAGQSNRARELLSRLEATPPDRVARSTEIARVLIGLGDHDRAIAALSYACDQRESGLGYLGSDPCWDPIAGDERFIAILRRRGLAGRSRPIAVPKPGLH